MQDGLVLLGMLDEWPLELPSNRSADYASIILKMKISVPVHPQELARRGVLKVSLLKVSGSQAKNKLPLHQDARIQPSMAGSR